MENSILVFINWYSHFKRVGLQSDKFQKVVFHLKLFGKFSEIFPGSCSFQFAVLYNIMPFDDYFMSPFAYQSLKQIILFQEQGPISQDKTRFC